MFFNFGDFFTSSQQNENGHYLLIAFPFIFYIGVALLRKRIYSLASKSENIFSIGAALSLLVPSIYLFVNQLAFNDDMLTFSEIFRNVNVYLSMILGFGILLKKYSLVQIAIPVSVVFGIAPLVNDPQGNLSMGSSLTNIFLSTTPLLVMFITKRNLLIKGQLTSLFVSVFVLIALSVNQDVFTTRVSVASFGTRNGSFYWFKEIGTSETLILISAVVILQMLTFIIIRFAFTKNKFDVIKDVKREIVIERRNFAKKLNSSYEIDFDFADELIAQFDFEELPKFTFTEENTILKFVNKVAKKIVPVAEEKALNSLGARAPSL